MNQFQVFLGLALVLFGLGLYTVLSRKNVIGILMGIELMLNAAALNFITFNFFRGLPHFKGHVFAIFIIVLAAAEAVTALALILAVYQQRKSLDVDNISEMRG